jgi:adenosylcobyric acid synthase
LLDPGLLEIASRTGVPILGVLPWLARVGLEEEDSLALPGAGGAASPLLDFAVLRLPHISNFTDFMPLGRLQGASLRYVESPAALGNPDVLFLPGSKHVRADLAFLRRSGLDRAVAAAAARNIPVFGLCGGYQMLGESITDAFGVEGEAGESEGLGLLPVNTRLEKEKVTALARAENLSLPFLPAAAPIEGYEIHMGLTSVPPGASPAIRIRDGLGFRPDGCAAPRLPVWGCYLHGIFASASICDSLRDWIRNRKGLPDSPVPEGPASDPYDGLADWLESHAPSVAFLGDPQTTQVLATMAKVIPGKRAEKD